MVTRGVRVTLVSFGEIPLPDQTAWMDLSTASNTAPRHSAWSGWTKLHTTSPESAEFLAALVREVQPDVLHLHQFCHGDLHVDVPRVIMAHGDLISWAQAVQGCTPQPTPWLKWYRDTVVRGIAAADAVVAPSRLDARHDSLNLHPPTP